MADRPEAVARCGGPKLCEQCRNEVDFMKAIGADKHVAASNDDVTVKVLLEYFVRDLKQTNQTRSYIPIEDVVARLERIIHN